MLAERRLLEPIAQSCSEAPETRLWQSLAALDAYRKRFEDTPDTLTNAILLGSLLVPLGYIAARPARRRRHGGRSQKEPRLALGMLPLARRDVERLRQILGLQRRLIDVNLSPRARRALMHRGPFREALTWLEIHGAGARVPSSTGAGSSKPPAHVRSDAEDAAAERPPRAAATPAAGVEARSPRTASRLIA